MAKIGLGKIAAGVIGVAAAGAAWFYLREKSIETPAHDVIDSDGAFELRRYPVLTVAQTVQRGTRDRALGNGFGLLADYIFAESREGDEIAMTAPVLATADHDGAWRIRFVMPAALAREALPEPGAGVEIDAVPARTMAVLRFNGRAEDRELAAREAELRGWMARKGLEAAGPVEHAFYNSPFMPGPLRHNEVQIPILIE
jgi:hypothetical protein